MSRQRSTRIQPMKTAGTQHFIERTYREGGAHQWVREVFINAMEAGATRVEFGVEWQAVESRGVYRRTIADNGRGMTADELREFFNTFGGGGKPIGGAHENFGVGSKTSLLPWNTYGLVVVSWVNGGGSMVWVEQDAITGEYGLRVFETIESDGRPAGRAEAVVPFEDSEHGCHWGLVKPDWVGDHGTVVVLLGDSQTSDTVCGDPTRQEDDIKGISSYLNRRIWEIPDNADVFVHELRYSEKQSWPPSEKAAFGSQPDAGYDTRINNRRIRGARYFIEYCDRTEGESGLKASGSVPLSDGTLIDWYLWGGDRPKVHSYAASGGFIGALYKNELYDVTNHHSTYRTFGVSEAAVRKNLWLIARPPAYDERSRKGVYPRTDRNQLLIKGGPDAGAPLPIHDWAGEFADAMPDEIRDAIRAARGGATGSLDDDQWRQRLAERFGSRWKIDKLRARADGTDGLEATQAGTTAHPTIHPAKEASRTSGGGGGGTGGNPNTGSTPGPLRAARAKVAGGIPSYRIVGPGEIEEGMIAAWQPHAVDFPQGVVLIDGSHPVLEQEIRHWQDQFADHHAEEVREIVLCAYGEIAVAKVAHSEFLKSHVPAAVVENDLRSNAALTMALLGLITEEAVIGPRLTAKFGKRRAA